MAARRVLRLKLCHLLNKPSGNVGINSAVRRQITSSSQEWNRFGSNHRFKTLLAGGCGLTLATAGFLTFRMFSAEAKARPLRFSEIESGKLLKEEYPKLSVTLYQYQNCPFCGKVRAFLDYYGIDYTIVEVSPIWKKEISFSAYKKVPLVIANEKQVRVWF